MPVHIDFARVTRFFFLFLFLLLFIGDGKQHAIDAVGLSLILSFYLMTERFTKQERAVPTKLNRMWFLFLLYVLFRTFYSDDIGYSLYALARYVEAYVLFYVFYTRSTVESQKTHAVTLLSFCALSLIAAFIFSYIGNLRTNIASMNLLFPAFGHNNIASILIIGAACLFVFVLPRRSMIAALGMTLFLISLLLTRARAATIVFGGFAVLFVLSLKNKALVASRRSLFVLVFVLVLLSVVQFDHPSFYFFSGSIGKSAFINDKRLEYWRQATLAIADKPVFGSGPGTFVLRSKRYQSRPQIYSWFAHGLALETAAELGLVGFALFGLLLVVILQRPIREILSGGAAENRAGHAMLSGALFATLFYSLVDFNLSYFIVWSITWSLTGSVAWSGRKELVRNKKPSLSYYGILIAFFIYSLLIITKPTDAGADSRIRSVRVIDALEQLETIQPGGPTEQGVIQTIERLHRNNSEIQFAIGELYEKNGYGESALRYYQKTIYAEPQNPAYLVAYLRLLSSINSPSDAGRDLVALYVHASSTKQSEPIRASSTNDNELLGLSLKSLMTRKNIHLADTYASLSYGLGMDLIQVRPDLTEMLWTLSRDLYPDVGFIHVELASFYTYVRKDEAKVAEVFMICQKHESPRRQCQEQRIKEILPPGEFLHML